MVEDFSAQSVVSMDTEFSTMSILITSQLSQLRELGKLRKCGVVSEDEFLNMKKNILATSGADSSYGVVPYVGALGMGGVERGDRILPGPGEHFVGIRGTGLAGMESTSRPGTTNSYLRAPIQASIPTRVSVSPPSTQSYQLPHAALHQQHSNQQGLHCSHPMEKLWVRNLAAKRGKLHLQKR